MAIPAFHERYGPSAVVTGAAAGIGRGFARRIAARGLDLLLADRDAAALAETAAELRDQYGVAVETLVADLTRVDEVENLCERANAADFGLLINNAGLGHTGWFMQIPIEDHLEEIDLNVRATLLLTHRLGQQLIARGRGGILFVSSTSAEFGSPSVANYAATKAYIRFLGEALFAELEPYGVHSLALSPGLTRTKTMSLRLGDEAARRLGAMEPEAVAEEGLRALGKRPAHIAGTRNRLLAILSRDLTPRARALRAGLNRMMSTGLGKPEVASDNDRP